MLPALEKEGVLKTEQNFAICSTGIFKLLLLFFKINFYSEHHILSEDSL